MSQVPPTDVGPGALGAINAHARVVVDYEPNPRNPGAQLVRDALMRLHGFLVPAVLGGDTDPGLQYHGITAPPLQNFKGAVNPASTSVVYAPGADISSAVVAGPMGDPARRIFADRLRRRQAGM